MTGLTSACARSLALFYGSFVALNLFGSIAGIGFDGNIWWIDLRWLPDPVGKAALVLFAGATLRYGLRPRLSRGARFFATGILAFAICALIANTLEFYLLLERGSIKPLLPAPITLLSALALLFIVAQLKGAQPEPEAPRSGTVFGLSAMFAALFAIIQMPGFGKTEYRRSGDAVVVFGARVYADGSLSDALLDRVATACDLYRARRVRMLIFSGGPGDGITHETEAMRRFAMDRGIPASAIILDRAGLNTRATVQNTIGLFRNYDVQRVLTVSHFYHLPRVKLAYQQAGWEVFTVPARSDRTLLKLPVFIAREVLALGKYYFEPLIWRRNATAVA
jgi:vancomycin permeability regulator SanA